MQLGVMNHRFVGCQDGRLYRRATRIGKPAVKRNVKDVMKVKIDSIRFKRIGKAMKRLVRRRFQVSDDSDYLVDGRFIEQAAGAMNQERDVFVKFNICRQL